MLANYLLSPGSSGSSKLCVLPAVGPSLTFVPGNPGGPLFPSRLSEACKSNDGLSQSVIYKSKTSVCIVFFFSNQHSVEVLPCTELQCQVFMKFPAGWSSQNCWDSHRLSWFPFPSKLSSQSLRSKKALWTKIPLSSRDSCRALKHKTSLIILSQDSVASVQKKKDTCAN